jgi:hypothetical protein
MQRGRRYALSASVLTEQIRRRNSGNPVRHQYRGTIQRRHLTPNLEAVRSRFYRKIQILSPSAANLTNLSVAGSKTSKVSPDKLSHYSPSMKNSTLTIRIPCVVEFISANPPLTTAP